MTRVAVVDIQTDELKFSAGHYMILSECARETFHGHDYQVCVSIEAEIKENGMAFDCRDVKLLIADLCRQLDFRFILPGESKHLKITESAVGFAVQLANETNHFSTKDAVVLPICNVTLEELSHWFLQRLMTQPTLADTGIRKICVKISNGRGESGASTSVIS